MINQVVLMGRLTRDVELRYQQGTNTAVAIFSLAVERDFKAQGAEKPETDFINFVSFNKTAEFIGKYFKQGSMLAVIGRIQTGSYTNKDGVKVYTTDVIVDKASFTGEKRDGQPAAQATPASGDGFMNIPDGLDDELPFK